MPWASGFEDFERVFDDFESGGCCYSANSLIHVVTFLPMRCLKASVKVL
jgi:hypothetical protein